MEEYLLDPNINTTERFSDICSKELKNLLIEQWKTKISKVTSNNGQSNKLGFYSRLKTTFEMEPYLKNVNNFYLRKQICKFRCSDHKLEIETGRHRKIDINSRICRICNSSIESEMHFLAICPLYESLRNRYFERKHENDLINLLKCKNKTDAFNIGNFIIKATKLRETTLRAP